MTYTDIFTEVSQDVELICQSVHVQKDVHEESIIDTRDLLVEGTTHQNTTQFSKHAKINVHQGLLRCHDADINLLDGGEVHATKVTIDSVQSGSIYAQDVIINKLSSNVDIYASKSISINTINGTGNTLCINYMEIPILMSKIDLIQDDIEELETSLYKAQKNNSSLEKGIKVELSRLQESLLEIQNSNKLAKVSIKEALNGKNTINFTIDQETSIRFQTNSQKYSPFYLEYTQDKIILHPTDTSININS